MVIANQEIASPALLAPMAGYTDMPFRLLCKEQGVGIVYTEFASSEGLIRDSQRTREYLLFSPRERPVAIQIFGHDPVSMTQAAASIEQDFKPDIIDINMGCPVRKVVKKGAGAALLKNPPLISAIVSHVKKSVRTPVTAKIRSGWNQDSINVLEVSQRLEDAGIAAIAVHPRTASMQYQGHSDWEWIARVKESVSVPVIGNGDIHSSEDAIRMIKTTACDAVMVGRGALGNPWIFRQINQKLEGWETVAEVTTSEKIEMCLRHIALEGKLRGEDLAHRIMKKHYRWYFRGFPGAAEMRRKLVRLDRISVVIEFLNHQQEKFNA